MAEREHSVDRRRFIKGISALGGALLIGGGTDSYFRAKKISQLRNEAQRELEEEGITRPDKKTLEHAQQIRNEKAEDTQKQRTPEEVWKAVEVQAQAGRFNKAIEERLEEKKNNNYTGLRLVGEILAVSTGVALAGNALNELRKG